MKNMIIAFALVASTWAATSNVAFTSYQDMMNQPVVIIKNELMRNTSNDPELAQCIYLRNWEAKYQFDNPLHDHIYYYIEQCLGDDMKVIQQIVFFNYDGGNERHPLPEGCVPPTPETQPENPCQNGFELGEEIIKDVATMVTKKLVDHPQDVVLDNEDPEEIPQDKMDEVIKKLPELEELLETVIEENHASNPENRQPDEVVENPDGTVTEKYNFPNGDVAEKTVKPDETTETVVKRPDGSTVTRVDKPDDTATIVEKDPQGNPVLVKEIVPKPEDPTQEIVTTKLPDGTPVGEPLERPRKPNDSPSVVDVPDDAQNLFNEISSTLGDTLEQYVENKVKCFAENIIDVKENYLTFVCSTTGHSSIKDALKARFGDAVVCGTHVDCDGLQEELLDKMVHDVNNGGDGKSEGVSVTSGVVSTTSQRRA